jgi:hypothetical protein
MIRALSSAKPNEKREVRVRIGDPRECAKAVSSAIAKEVNEEFRARQCARLEGEEVWQLAETKALQPLCCGILESSDGAVVSTFCSTLGAKDLKEIEVYVEPHRLILAAKNAEGAGLATAYRVLPFADEVDPVSVKAALKQNGALLEVKVRKVGQGPLVQRRAA